MQSEAQTQPMPRRRANTLCALLAALYLAWQYLMPLFTLHSQSALVGYCGTLLALALIVVAFVVHGSELIAAGKGMLFWALALILLGVFSAVASGSPGVMGSVIGYIYQLVTIALIYAIFSALSYYEGTVKLLLYTLVAMALINGAIAVWGAASGRTLYGAEREDVGAGSFGYDETTGRSGGLRGENYSGAWAAPALAVGFLLLFRRWYNPMGIVIAGISVLSVVVSLSRTSVATAAVIFLAAMIASIKKKVRVVNAILLIVILIAGFYAGRTVLSWQTGRYSSRMGTETEERWQAENLFADRVIPWTNGIRLGMYSPVWGHGPGSIVFQLQELPHNSMLDAFVELGILGVMIYFWPMAKTVVFIFRNFKGVSYDEYLAPLVCALFGMLATWMALSNMYMKTIWIMAAMVTGRSAYLMDMAAREQYVEDGSQELLEAQEGILA